MRIYQTLSNINPLRYFFRKISRIILFIKTFLIIYITSFFKRYYVSKAELDYLLKKNFIINYALDALEMHKAFDPTVAFASSPETIFKTAILLLDKLDLTENYKAISGQVVNLQQCRDTLLELLLQEQSNKNPYLHIKEDAFDNLFHWSFAICGVKHLVYFMRSTISLTTWEKEALIVESRLILEGRAAPAAIPDCLKKAKEIALQGLEIAAKQSSARENFKANDAVIAEFLDNKVIDEHISENDLVLYLAEMHGFLKGARLWLIADKLAHLEVLSDSINKTFKPAFFNTQNYPYKLQVWLAGLQKEIEEEIKYLRTKPSETNVYKAFRNNYYSLVIKELYSYEIWLDIAANTTTKPIFKLTKLLKDNLENLKNLLTSDDLILEEKKTEIIKRAEDFLAKIEQQPSKKGLFFNKKYFFEILKSERILAIHQNKLEELLRQSNNNTAIKEDLISGYKTLKKMPFFIKKQKEEKNSLLELYKENIAKSSSQNTTVGVGIPFSEENIPNLP